MRTGIIGQENIIGIRLDQHTVVQRNKLFDWKYK